MNMIETTTEALEARLDRLRTRAASVHAHIQRLNQQHDALLDLICDVIFTLDAREIRDMQAKCPHPGLADGACSECGLPADQLPHITTTTWREASETETK